MFRKPIMRPSCPLLLVSCVRVFRQVWDGPNLQTDTPCLDTAIQQPQCSHECLPPLPSPLTALPARLYCQNTENSPLDPHTQGVPSEQSQLHKHEINTKLPSSLIKQSPCSRDYKLCRSDWFLTKWSRSCPTTVWGKLWLKYFNKKCMWLTE